MAHRVVKLDEKDPEEVVVLAFDFAAELGAETLSSPVFSVSVHRGNDANVAQLPNGAPVISGTQALQSVRAGVAGVDYYVRMRASTSGGRTLVLAGILPVREAGR